MSQEDIRQYSVCSILCVLYDCPSLCMGRPFFGGGGGGGNLHWLSKFQFFKREVGLTSRY